MQFKMKGTALVAVLCLTGVLAAPFAQRVLFSSVLGTPIDSVVFLGILGWLSAPGVLAMTASKMVGALIVWNMVRQRMESDRLA